MNTRTGAIARFENLVDAKRAGFDEPLTEEEAEKLSYMNRHERRRWAREKRKERKQ